jgi:hypothetical protein
MRSTNIFFLKPAEKKMGISVIKNHGSSTVECCRELQDSCHMLHEDMQNLRVCIQSALECPSQLDRCVPDNQIIAVAKTKPDLAIVAEAKMKHVNDGLNSFLLKPAGLSGSNLFAHLVCKRESSDALTCPSPHLDAEILESNRHALQTTKSMMTKREIMKESGGDGATMKLSARQLDHVGQVKSHSGLVNTKEAMDAFQRQLTLAKSVASMLQKFDKAAAAKKKNDFTSSAPTPALAKLSKKNDNVSKLTKPETCSLLFASR